MTTMVRCDWCGVITECQQRDREEWVCGACWAEALEQVRALYDPDDGPILAEDADGKRKHCYEEKHNGSE